VETSRVARQADVLAKAVEEGEVRPGEDAVFEPPRV